MEEIQKEISKIDNKIAKQNAQLKDKQNQINKNIEKISQIKEDAHAVGDVTMYSNILSKLVKQKYNINVKIAKLTKDKNDLTKHFSKIEFN